MEKKVFSIKKIIVIIVLTFTAVAGTAASATALSTKQKNVIPVVNKICSAVAEKAAGEQSWVSAYSQCISTQRVHLEQN